MFVLDFRNDTDDIVAAFEPWYGMTVAPPTDPNLLYDTFHALEAYGVVWPGDVDTFVALLLAEGAMGDHAALSAAVDAAVVRFGALEPADQDGSR